LFSRVPAYLALTTHLHTFMLATCVTSAFALPCCTRPTSVSPATLHRISSFSVSSCIEAKESSVCTTQIAPPLLSQRQRVGQDTLRTNVGDNCRSQLHGVHAFSPPPPFSSGTAEKLAGWGDLRCGFFFSATMEPPACATVNFDADGGWYKT
jgi:hypothetical protein